MQACTADSDADSRAQPTAVPKFSRQSTTTSKRQASSSYEAWKPSGGPCSVYPTDDTRSFPCSCAPSAAQGWATAKTFSFLLSFREGRKSQAERRTNEIAVASTSWVTSAFPGKKPQGAGHCAARGNSADRRMTANAFSQPLPRCLPWNPTEREEL